MNVILISVDNLRFDCAGFQTDKSELEKFNVLRYLNTPTLNSFAEESLCFTQCISTNTYTTASHASILTGLYPPKHGVRAFFETKLNSRVITLAEMLKKNGYRTILYTDVPDLFKPLCLSRGFEFNLSRSDGMLFDLIRHLGDEKIFLFVHFFDVHEPFLHNTNDYAIGSNDDYFAELLRLYREYELLKLYDKTSDVADLWNRLIRGPLRERPIDILLPLYIRGVTKFDTGRFRYFFENLDALGFSDDALVAIFSDHGEGRCSVDNKNYFSHAGELFDNVLRVPFVLRHPGIRPSIDDKLMSTVDIFPTVLALLDIDSPGQIDGIDILSQKRDMAYAEFWKGRGAALYATSDGRIRSDSEQWPEFILDQMAVRTTSRKFIIKNKGNTWRFENKEVSALTNAEYVELLYEELLGRPSDADGFAYYVYVLNSGAKTMQEVFLDFLGSEEYKLAPKYTLFDLEKDLFEEFPVELSWNEEVNKYINSIAKIDSCSVETERIFSDKSESALEMKMRGDQPVIGSLQEMEKKSIEVIKEAVRLYGANSIGVAWTGGKDSTTVLHLIKQEFGHIPFKVINVDTSVKFPEIYAFRDELWKMWKFDLRIFRNEIPKTWLREAKDHAECCYRLKTVPLKQAILSLGLKVIITGVRWDEQEARADEEYFSFRENPAHVRVQPILHFRETDIWQYIRGHNVPYCSLYDRGYRSIGCMPCTDISPSAGPERSGRAREKEEMMSKLRKLGYF